MGPTILRHKNYRFFFFSREEPRMHIHISSAEGEAKFWLEPVIALADFEGLSKKQLNELQELTEKHAPEFTKAWKKHFANR